ncbi:MAG: N-acetyltransferase family protein [Deferribacterales bacterium]
MSVIMREIRQGDAEEFMEIVNYYIRNTFNAYPEHEMELKWFDVLYDDFKDYPNICVYDEDKGRLAGYMYMRAYRKFSCFDRTAEITYFISPEYTGQGYGSKMLTHAIAEAKKKGIKVILAHISSLNEGSLRFHEKHGFEKCGHFKNAVEKNGTVFDTVWMQLEI